MGNSVSTTTNNNASFDDALLNRLKADFPAEYEYYQSGGKTASLSTLGSFDTETTTTSQVGRQLFGNNSQPSYDLKTEKVLTSKMSPPSSQPVLAGPLPPAKLSMAPDIRTEKLIMPPLSQTPQTLPPLSQTPQTLPPLSQTPLPPLSQTSSQTLPPLSQATPPLSQATPPLSQATPPLSQATPPLSQTPSSLSQPLPPSPPPSLSLTPVQATPGGYTNEQLISMDRDQLNGLCQSNPEVNRLVCSGKSVSNKFWRERTQRQFPDTKPGMIRGFEENDDWLIINFLRNVFRNIEKNNPLTKNKWNFNSMSDIRNHITKNCNKLDLTGGDIKNIPDKLALKQAIGLDGSFELIIWTKSETI